MKHLPSIEERVEEFKKILQDAYTHNLGEQKSRMDSIPLEEYAVPRIEKTLTSDRHAIGERILEWAESNKKETKVGKYLTPTTSEHNFCYNSALTDLQTFIKSELLK